MSLSRPKLDSRISRSTLSGELVAILMPIAPPKECPIMPARSILRASIKLTVKSVKKVIS